jgi:hypothetical protein
LDIVSSSFNIIFLPQTFSAIIQNSSSGHLYYELIFEQVAHNLVNFDKVQFEEKFPTELSVVDWCIDVVIDNYIFVASHMLRRNERKKK